MHNENIQSYFYVGFLYHEGKYIERNIQKAIHFYKEGSSFNDNYAKNNLGILFKNGFEDEIEKKIGYAIEFFRESIKQTNDPVSMYNLAHIYIYEEPINGSIDESIKLLLGSLEKHFLPSFDLLNIALVKKYKNDLSKINDELSNYSGEHGKILGRIIKNIQCSLLNNLFNFELAYDEFRYIDFLYNISLELIQSNKIVKEKIKSDETNNKYNINFHFYEGFGNI